MDQVDEGENWLDENPYFLMLSHPVGERDFYQQIDLGEPAWKTKYASVLAIAPATWYLVRKVDHQVAIMLEVQPGDSPAYVARHVGFLPLSGDGPVTETVAYGLGRNERERAFILANGTVVIGEDVDPIARKLLRVGLLS